MAKTAEQRAKDLDAGVTWVLDTAWGDVASKFKEVNTPIFKKNGDIGALAKRYDGVVSKFEAFRTQLDKAGDIFDSGGKQLDKMEEEEAGLQKELDDIDADSQKSIKQTGSAKIEDQINDWEESLKANQDVTKERKAVFERWMKLDAAYDKAQADLIAKAKKAVDAAKAGMNSTNAELNNLEGQMRAINAKYQKVALDMSRKDIADGVRGFLAIFGK